MSHIKAVITGAGSGIGLALAKELSKHGYDLIVVGRREEKLRKLKTEVKTAVNIIVLDISTQENCVSLFEQLKNEDIDMFINNAGFGVFGEFTKTKLEDEIKLIQTNVVAVHILTKLFLQYFEKRNHGYILNVASLAAFMPGGPLFSSYYASKSYVYTFSIAIYEELRRKKSNVNISVLCPGSVLTEFADVAKVSFGGFGLTPEYVAKYTYKKMMKHKLVIIPSKIMKLPKQLIRFAGDKTVLKLVYSVQNSKTMKNP